MLSHSWRLLFAVSKYLASGALAESTTPRATTTTPQKDNVASGRQRKRSSSSTTKKNSNKIKDNKKSLNRINHTDNPHVKEDGVEHQLEDTLELVLSSIPSDLHGESRDRTLRASSDSFAGEPYRSMHLAKPVQPPHPQPPRADKKGGVPSPALDAGSVGPVRSSLPVGAAAALPEPFSRAAMNSEHNRRLVNVGETAAPGETHLANERIERRRSKFSVSDSELLVGITERLFPEIRRLSALHELHYGDSILRELDSCTYLSQVRHDALIGTCGGVHDTMKQSPAQSLEIGLDDDFDFARFEEESKVLQESADTTAAGTTVTNPTQSATLLDGNNASGGSTSDEPDTLRAPPETDGCVTGHELEAADSSSSPLGELDSSPCEGEDVDRMVQYSVQKPWFITAEDGVVRLQPLPLEDCLLTLEFLLRLRGQGVSSLPETLREKAYRAQNQVAASQGAKKQGTVSGSSLAPSTSCLTLMDIIHYLDDAPAPIIGYTDNLYPREQLRSPAFLFTLYVENVSVQNALGHLSALFSIPQKSFFTRTSANKMSCASLLCALEANRLCREHLLLVNTMRHPGFVMRISGIREMPAEAAATTDLNGPDDGAEVVAAKARCRTPSPSEALFGELSRWEPLYEIEMLLRRVACRGRPELEHRMRAVREVGAVFYCANREPALGRAATDILHGFYKSALLNALQRRKPPMAMRQFLMHPNVVTAARARRASTDATIRQTLKGFIATNGDWRQTAARVPYVWRRRWINALRASVWNTMASKRIRVAGRKVLVGDAVIRPSYRSDVHRRLLTTVKTEYIKIVETLEEAEQYTLEDVFIPFLRGGHYPAHCFAPAESEHVIMSEANMLKILQDAHAQHLLLGFPDEAKTLLDIRVDVAPLLWRRLLLRPMAMTFTIFEDKAPLRSTHFDAGRILKSDRWDVMCEDRTATPANVRPSSPDFYGIDTPGFRSATDDATTTTTSPLAPFPTQQSNLVTHEEILERTTIGAQFQSRTTPRDFFSIPSSDQYVVPGHAKRFLEGEVVASAPHAPAAALGDRLYTLHIRAITRHGMAGLTQVLREYFILSGVEAELDGGLQHKVHRIRRELDPETLLLTAPVYCTACYNRDHNTLDQCAEYRLKQQRRRFLELQAPAVVAAKEALEASSGGALHGALEQGTAASQPQQLPTDPLLGPTRLALELGLRRRSPSDKWGVHLTQSLLLTRLEDAKRVASVRIWHLAPGCSAAHGAASASRWPSWFVSEVLRSRAGVLPEEGSTCQDSSNSDVALSVAPPEQHKGVEPFVRFLSSLFSEGDLRGTLLQRATSARGTDDGVTMVSLMNSSVQNAVLLARRNDSVGRVMTATDSDAILKRCEWSLKGIDGAEVEDRRGVAAAFVRSGKSCEVTLTFEATLRAPTSSDSPPHHETGEASLSISNGKGGDCVETQGSLHNPPHKGFAELFAGVPFAMRVWLCALPDTFHLTIAKSVPVEVGSSWGLRIQGEDLLLVNFADILARYAAPPGADAPLSQQPHGRVLSITPSDSLSREALQAVEGGLSAAIRCLARALNAMYQVTRLNGVRVNNRASLLAAMMNFDAAIPKAGKDSPDTTSSPTPLSSREEHGDAALCCLDIELKRCAESHAWAAPAVGEHLQEGSHGVETGPRSSTDALLAVGDSTPPFSRPGTERTKNTAASDASASSLIAINDSSVVVVPLNLRDGSGLLTERQAAHRVLTIAINRRFLNAQTKDRWGLRVQRGTCRLIHIQHDRYFSFVVYAYKQQQSLRASHALRFYGATGRESKRERAGEAEGGHVAEEERFLSEGAASFVSALYFITAVNHDAVAGEGGGSDALRGALRRAAAAESVTLRVRHFMLARVVVAVRRGGANEPSALAPIGLSLNSDLCVVGIEPGSAVANGVLAATGPHCTLRGLLQPASANTPGMKGIAIPALKTSWERFYAVLMGAVNAAPTPAGSNKVDRRARYSLDEDKAERSGGGGATFQCGLGSSSMTSPDGGPMRRGGDDVSEALRMLAKVCSDTIADLERCVMVDGLHLLQSMLLQEFTTAQLRRYHDLKAENECTDDNVVAAERDSMYAQRQKELHMAIKNAVDSVLQDLEECEKHIKWRLTYAVNAGMTLRTPKDVQEAIRPGVSEESLVLQQYLLEY